jgi:hypothetical protein
MLKLSGILYNWSLYVIHSFAFFRVFVITCFHELGVFILEPELTHRFRVNRFCSANSIWGMVCGQFVWADVNASLLRNATKNNPIGTTVNYSLLPNRFWITSLPKLLVKGWRNQLTVITFLSHPMTAMWSCYLIREHQLHVSSEPDDKSSKTWIRLPVVFGKELEVRCQVDQRWHNWHEMNRALRCANLIIWVQCHPCSFENIRNLQLRTAARSTVQQIRKRERKLFTQ